MVKLLKIFILVIGCFLFLASNEKKHEVPSLQNIAIIPEPAQIVLGEGTFEFNAKTQFVAIDEGQKEVSSLLIDKFNKK